jgi:hypothetical protein
LRPAISFYAEAIGGALNFWPRTPALSGPPKSVAAGVANMTPDRKHQPHQRDGDAAKRKREDRALDDALKDTFPASDPVSIEQPAHHRPPKRDDTSTDDR